jgi:hypothetical protein
MRPRLPAAARPDPAGRPPFNTPRRRRTVHPQMRGAIRFDETCSRPTPTREAARREVTGLQGQRRADAHVRGLSVEPAGRTYKRLIAVDGKPLPQADLARRDEEHRRTSWPSMSATSGNAGRTHARLAKEAQERRERDAIVNDAFAI